MADPVDQQPIPALLDSYVFHSELPSEAARAAANEGGWIMGIDEAGRGRECGRPCRCASEFRR